VQPEDVAVEARVARGIYAHEMQKRVLSSANVHDRDLIACVMDPSRNPVDTLGPLYPRAQRAYSRFFAEVEARIGLSKPVQEKRDTKKQKTAGKSGFCDLQAMLAPTYAQSSDDLDDTEAVVEPHRVYTEMESLAELRRFPEKHAPYLDEHGRFDMFLLAKKTRAERPVHYVMTLEIFPDLHSEGVAESCFSTHANFAGDLRKTTDPKVVAKMVFGNRNFDLLWDKIKKKIEPRYTAKWGRAL
jgi:hypothetical protein